MKLRWLIFVTVGSIVCAIVSVQDPRHSSLALILEELGHYPELAMAGLALWIIGSLLVHHATGRWWAQRTSTEEASCCGQTAEAFVFKSRSSLAMPLALVALPLFVFLPTLVLVFVSGPLVIRMFDAILAWAVVAPLLLPLVWPICHWGYLVVGAHCITIKWRGARARTLALDEIAVVRSYHGGELLIVARDVPIRTERRIFMRASEALAVSQLFADRRLHLDGERTAS